MSADGVAFRIVLKAFVVPDHVVAVGMLLVTSEKAARVPD
jgi:hypothetical protein